MKSSGQSQLLDIGGSFIKGTVVRDNGVALVHRSPVPQFTQKSGKRREVDIKLFVKATREMANFLKTEYGASDATFLSGQMGGLVLVDGSGSQILEALSWQDQRSLEQSSLGKGLHTDSFWQSLRDRAFPGSFDSSGRDIKPGSQISQLYTLRMECPTLFRSKPKAFTLLGYIANSLASSLDNPIVHLTDAASTGLYDIYKNRWNYEVLNSLDIEISLPSVVDDIQPIRSRDNSSNGIYYTAIGDQQASLLGAGISRKRAVVNIGTGGQVAKLKNPGDSDETGELYQTRPFFNRHKLATVTHLPAGRLLSLLVNKAMGSETPDTYEKFFDLSKGIGKSFDLDPDEALSGEFDFSAIDPGETARSFLRLMVSRYESAILGLGIEASHKIVFAGGVAKKFEIFCEQLSITTGLTYEISSSDESTLEGLAKISKSFTH